MTDSTVLLRPAAVLFDFDGTLVNTEPSWHEAQIEVVAEEGADWTQEDSDALIGAALPKIAAALHDKVGNPDLTPDELLERVIDKVIEAVHSPDVLLPGAIELMQQVHATGVPVGIVSASYRRIIEPLFAHVEAELISVIVAGDDVRNHKPHPEPYLIAARKLGVDPGDVLAIEDSIPGTASANAAGAAVVAVTDSPDVPEAPRRVFVESLADITAERLWGLYETAIEPTLSGTRHGPLQPGEWVTLTDPKGRRHSVHLTPGKTFHTTKGGIEHDAMIGGPDGVVVTSVGGLRFTVLRPLLNEFMVTMPREAAVIYPKDAAQIIMGTDIFPGARVLEAGVGSGSLTLALLRAIGPGGRLDSYERRADFADVARKNVERFLSGHHPAWHLRVGDLVEAITDEPIDRAILDMLAPWECIDAVAERLVAGGVLTCYVATTTQMGRTMDTLRVHGEFTEPEATETTTRGWHAEGLAIRPGHATSGHTGFLVTARRLAPGVKAPMRKRRPAPGAYGPDYQGPRPANIPPHSPHVDVEGSR